MKFGMQDDFITKQIKFSPESHFRGELKKKGSNLGKPFQTLMNKRIVSCDSSVFARLNRQLQYAFCTVEISNHLKF